ncbi:UDP-N-acetylmuramoyl-tripeptide--D-alanyl-D-alanine ligase [Arcanobacterium pinnipediorum]|uniref:UDP-N-acetylmuramoyl-tripeptide--D-alanyl-D-alanine ligase n=1 Tax=Arcanobacterium pinnipediorum TaxID=1503041 RepID=A0ABY5AII3_9ACTO|nr:UDP-N-acetylmuramoyl-tripeptide--D-alanyl-D-alanine ligase [Arcanobacterium pinnipediorum]USR80027.1 UDP-N-acetylmuramoyl-tripeptide--D-alanyl-D-alanine ligase [Arcanobacterium pinnipediorum]
MITMTFEEVARSVNATSSSTPSIATRAVRGISTDNRRITPGDVFVAIAGERADGNTYAQAAIEAGAVGVISADKDRAIASGVDPELIISVQDPIEALGLLAHAQAQLLRVEGAKDFHVVAVTGSVGKTTTKDLLALLLRNRGPIVAPPGSFNNELGLPLTVLQAEQTTATLVVEMGADHIGNIDYLTGIIQPDISVVLAVGRAHIGEFGGIDNIALAKSELVRGTRPGGIVVLNYDDERVRNMAKDARGDVVYFSASGQHTEGVWASDISTSDTGHASFTLHYGDQQARVDLGLVGRHHVTNALAAASVALLMGSTVSQCAQDLTHARAGSPHRMDVWNRSGITIIDDSYNANPDSMRAGLQALSHIGHGRRTIAVLGQMLELGESSQSEHRDIGTIVAELGIDILIGFGPGIEPIIEAAHTRGVRVESVAEVSQAMHLLDTLIDEGDVVLLKGSNGSGVWRLADALKEIGR